MFGPQSAPCYMRWCLGLDEIRMLEIVSCSRTMYPHILLVSVVDCHHVHYLTFELVFGLLYHRLSIVLCFHFLSVCASE